MKIQDQTNTRLKPLPFRSSNPIDVEQSILQTTKKNRKNPVLPSTYEFVIGTDESGTGCIAGPIIIVSASIIQQPIHQYESCLGVMDSKSLSADDCYAIYRHVQDHPHIYAFTASYISSRAMNPSSAVLPRLIMQAMADSIETLIEESLWDRISPASKRDVWNGTSSKVPVPIYSIVDGHRAPSDFFTKYLFPCRPYKHGDAMVYTIALASCIARHLHEVYMSSLSTLYPQYQFQVHGGYPTAEHIQAIHRFGVKADIHRTSCAPIQKILHNTVQFREDVSSVLSKEAPSQPIDDTTEVAMETIRTTTQRKSTLLGGYLASTARNSVLNRKSFVTAWMPPSILLLLARPCHAIYRDRTTGISFPEVGEIEACVPRDWTLVENPFLDDPALLFTRLDTTADSVFYSEPRFVEHIDPFAVDRLTQYIDALLHSMDVRSCLDLCASWTSHISSSPPTLQRLAGLGMNIKELQANTLLTEFVVQDLNRNPVLPYTDSSFDIVLCQLSIDYLIHPFKVCMEIGRVLRENGSVYFFFSNRSFLTKAVALWTGQDDVDHTFTVASYLQYCHSPPIFSNIQAQDLSRRDRKGQVIGDPLYVVSASAK